MSTRGVVSFDRPGNGSRKGPNRMVWFHLSFGEAKPYEKLDIFIVEIVKS